MHICILGKKKLSDLIILLMYFRNSINIIIQIQLMLLLEVQKLYCFYNLNHQAKAEMENWLF